MRVFLDTNVLVSALATRGLCADVLRIVVAGRAPMPIIAPRGLWEELGSNLH